MDIKSPQTMEKSRTFKLYDLIMALFVTVLIVSNIASSAKIIDWGVSIGSVRLAFDAGTILFPISYIFGDILTEVYGYRKSRRVIWAGFFCLALSALVFGIVQALPGESSWAEKGAEAYPYILGGMSSGGIVLASLLAYFAGEFSNSFVLAKMKIFTRGRWLWSRTIGSTLVGELVDTAVFVVIASALGVFSWELFVTLVVTNYLFKVGVEVLMTPVTYGLVRLFKRVESEDYYDIGTNFSPFRIE